MAKAAQPDGLVIDTDGCCVRAPAHASSALQLSPQLSAEGDHHCGSGNMECVVDQQRICACTTAAEQTVDSSTCSRPTNDYLVAHFGYVDLINAPDKYELNKPISKPVVGHEVECYEGWPAITRGLVGTDSWNQVPTVLHKLAARMDTLGLRHEEELWTAASTELHTYTYKREYEAVRLSDVQGYHQQILQSEWATKFGIVGTNYASWGVVPSAYREFNGPVVLLQTGLEPSYDVPKNASTLQLSAHLSVSNFGEGGLQRGCAVSWKLRGEAAPIDGSAPMVIDAVGKGVGIGVGT